MPSTHVPFNDWYYTRYHKYRYSRFFEKYLREMSNTLIPMKRDRYRTTAGFNKNMMRTVNSVKFPSVLFKY